VAGSSNDGAACPATGNADLAIAKTGPATVGEGGTTSWTLTITNNGPTTSSGFVVTDDVPSGVTAVASTTAGCVVTGNAVVCSEGVLANGAHFVVTITGNAPSAQGTVTNAATVSGNENDPNLSNNTSSSSTSVCATTCPVGDNCGTVPDGCGTGNVSCGTCTTGQTCNSSNQCVSTIPDAGGGSDAGTGVDGGADSGNTADTGLPDSAGADASEQDAATDSGSGNDAEATGDSGAPRDSGNELDSGVTLDSGGFDSGSVSEVDGSMDGSSAASSDGGNAGGAGSNAGCGCHTAVANEAGPSPALLTFAAIALLGGLRLRRRSRR
jgi:uncharacterized repeat protein (TIGR01451 family)/MYXO-CTERM domain-containing protein